MLASPGVSSENLAVPPSARIAVYIQPRAKRTEIVGRQGAALKIRVTAPPVDGAANEALIAFVAGRLGLRQRDVRLVAGTASRHKMLEIDGMTAEQAERRLRSS